MKLLVTSIKLITTIISRDLISLTAFTISAMVFFM